VHQGQNMGLTADVNSGRVGQAPTLWAALLVDKSGFGVFDINTVALAPNTPIVGFATVAAGR
jgi:Tfp pilus assembly protein PilX